MTADQNKGITTINYNEFYQPVTVTFNSNANTRISYNFNSLGQKFRKIVKSIKYDNSSLPYNVADTTDYLQGFQYTNSKLSFFPVAGGYVKHTVSGTVHNYSYIYHYTDHLGNIRLSYTRNNDGTPAVMEENHYYPFGLKHENYNAEVLDIMAPEENLAVGGGFETNVVVDSRKSYQYKYNGKEWQDELGLNFYDYGARNYDPAIGRWMNIDPLAEKYRRWSPYNYAVDNPIINTDPDGMGVNNVVINGDLANKAVAQLNANSNLKITRDEGTGQLSASGTAKGKTDKALLAAINDKTTTVEMNATSSNTTKSGNDLVIGSFEGSTVNNNDGTVVAETTYNPNQGEIADNLYETGGGAYAKHEILESYNAAVDSPGAKPTTFDEIKNNSPNSKPYLNAHSNAMKQDKHFVEPTTIFDVSTGIYSIQKMKEVPGIIGLFPVEQNLYKK